MKFFNKILVGAVAASSLLLSCTKDFVELNTDPNRIDQISPGTLLNPIIYGMAAHGIDRSDAITFDLMQVALPFPSAQGGLHRYDVSENIGNSTWNNSYRWATNVKEMYAASVRAEDPNYQAIALTLNAWIYSNLTDAFGPVPMTEAARGDEQIFQPRFDKQEDIYAKLLADLESANSLYDASRDMEYGTDILYGNSISKWRKFTNSLHMRLLLRLSKTNLNTYAKLESMIADPSTYPVFTSNADGAVLSLDGITPMVSPWGRAIDFGLFRAAGKFFTDNLNAFNDPRLPIFNTEARDKTGNTVIGYKGIPSGYTGSENQFDYIPSNVNNALVTAPMIVPILTYAEVQFIKAEVALQAGDDVAAKAAYEKGVKAAIEQWGIDMPADYFDNPAAAFDGTLERIILQKYYALYFVDYQQWFEYRRTGYPVLPKEAGMENNQQLPVRFYYPIEVRNNNPENYQEAVGWLGSDDINTKVWWEK